MSLLELIKDNSSHAIIPETVYNDIIKPIYEETVDAELSTVEFDPEKHLRFYALGDLEKHKFNNTRRLTMEELGCSSPQQISPIGVSDPFPLFTDEAIQIMKTEILSKEVFLEHARFNTSSSGKDCTMRGYASADGKIKTPFTHAAWTHPKTLELVSTMAGIELEIVMDYEIAHVNCSMRDKEQAQEEIKAHEYNHSKRDLSKDCVVGWHNDSYPFVCVLMLSDTTNMIGGETSLRMGKSSAAEGNVAVVPGPTKGYGAVLQGRLIEHIAPNPLGVSERITMVTSYRAKDHSKPDSSVLFTVQPEVNYGSRYKGFYADWIKSRSAYIIDNLENLNKKIEEEKEFDKEATIAELNRLEEYLTASRTEMVMTGDDWKRAEGLYNKLYSDKK